jgi:hypothetical protein
VRTTPMPLHKKKSRTYECLRGGMKTIQGYLPRAIFRSIGKTLTIAAAMLRFRDSVKEWGGIKKDSVAKPRLSFYGICMACQRLILSSSRRAQIRAQFMLSLEFVRT